jgi:hypothetical protein
MNAPQWVTSRKYSPSAGFESCLSTFLTAIWSLHAWLLHETGQVVGRWRYSCLFCGVLGSVVLSWWWFLARKRLRKERKVV